MSFDTDRFQSLTGRELEVLQMAAEGLTPKVIAGRLDRSERTVYIHLNSAAKKLGATSAREAAMLLARHQALGPFAEPAKQSLQVAPPVPFLIDLLIPELSGRRYNDLALTRRLVVIVTRTLLIALALLAVTSLVRDVGIIVGRHG